MRAVHFAGLIAAGSVAACSLTHDVGELVDGATGGTGGATTATTGGGGAGGAGGATTTAATGGGGSTSTSCVPLTCFDLSPGCGPMDDGCGGTVTCNCVAPSSCVAGFCECPAVPITTAAMAPTVATGNNGAGLVTWGNATNVKSSTDGGAAATASIPASKRSKNLQARAFDFSLVPDDAEIDSVTLTVCRWKGNNTGAISLKDDQVNLIVAGQIVGSPNLALDVSWIYNGGVCEVAPYTFSNLDLAAPLTPATVKDPFFGANLVVKNPLASGSNANANVDWMKMSVAYFEPCTAESE